MRLRAAAEFVAEYRNSYEPDAELLAYQRDLLASFGIPLQEDRLRAGSNITFGELAVGALRGMAEPVPAPDLLIVAHGLADWYPFQAVSARLDHMLGGGAYNFAISQQGVRAPYTALRIGRAYAASGRCRTLALVVVEQTTFAHWEAGDPPTEDSSVFLLFGGTGGLELATAPPGRHATDLLDLPDRTLLVAGPGIDARWLAGLGLDLHQAAPGSRCTSVWRELANHHESWATAYDAVVLCDTDPRTGHSEAALFRREGNT
jgi:hypothetical protein